jgi:hypothetical protein
MCKSSYAFVPTEPGNLAHTVISGCGTANAALMSVLLQIHDMHLQARASTLCMVFSLCDTGLGSREKSVRTADFDAGHVKAADTGWRVGGTAAAAAGLIRMWTAEGRAGNCISQDITIAAAAVNVACRGWRACTVQVLESRECRFVSASVANVVYGIRRIGRTASQI